MYAMSIYSSVSRQASTDLYARMILPFIIIEHQYIVLLGRGAILLGRMRNCPGRCIRTDPPMRLYQMYGETMTVSPLTFPQPGNFRAAPMQKQALRWDFPPPRAILSTPQRYPLEKT